VCCLLLARRSIERSAIGIEHSSRRLLVLTCEQWRHGWLDRDAVWGGEWGRARYGCIRYCWWSSKGKGQFGNAEMAYWSIIDSCVKSWKYFPTQNVSLNSAKEWLSYCIVRYKIKLGVEEKFKCKNATKQTQHSDTPVQWKTYCCGTAYSGIRRAYGRIREPNLTRLDSFWMATTC